MASCIHISLVTPDYRTVRWHLIHASSGAEWSNVLILVELLFSSSASNGKVESVYLQLNIITSEKRTSLNNDTLDDLLMIRSMNTTLAINL